MCESNKMSSDAFVLPVSTLVGSSCEVSAKAADTVADLKKRICGKLSISTESVRLLNSGRELSNGRLSDYDVREGSRLFLVPEIKSGLEVVHDPQSESLQGIARSLLDAVAAEDGAKPVKVDIRVPRGDGNEKQIELIVTPSAGTSSKSSTDADEQPLSSTGPEMLLCQRLSALSAAGMRQRSLAALRGVAQVSSNIVNHSMANGLSADMVYSQHRLLDEVERSLFMNKVSEDDGDLREVQQLLCDLSKMFEQIQAAAEKRQKVVLKETSAVLSPPQGVASVDGRTKRREVRSRPAHAIAKENQAMHRKLLHLQKAMAERRRSKDGVRLGKRRPLVVRAPPPPTGFGGLRRGFLLARA